MEQLASIALQSEVVSIACGLDLSRDVATHFLQQRLLVSQVELARRIHLPIVIREKAASDKVIEVIAQSSSSQAADSTADWQLRVAVHSFSGSDAQLTAYVQAGFYVMINGLICDLRVDNSSSSSSSRAESEDGSTTASPPLLLPELAGEGATLFRQLRGGLLPMDRLLLCSDAPLYTPQNIDDVHIRSQRNEPANLTYVHDIVAKAYRVTSEQLIQQLNHNACTFYQLHYKASDSTDDSKQAADSAHSEHDRRDGSKADQTNGQTSSDSTGKANKQVAALQQRMREHHIAQHTTARGEQTQPASDDDSAEAASEEQSEEAEGGEDEDEDERETESDERSESPTTSQQRQQEDGDGESAEEDEEQEERDSAHQTAGVTMAAAGRRNRNKLGAEAREHSDDDWKVGNKNRRKPAAATGPVKGKAHDRLNKQTHSKEGTANQQGQAEEKEQKSEEEAADSSSSKDTAQQQPSTGRRQQSAAAPSGATSSRHRLVGGDVDLSLDRDILRYACRRCRTVLFSEDDVIPHANRAQTDQSAAAPANSASTSHSASGGRKKSHLSSAELTHCESTFIRPMAWMRNIHTSGSSSNQQLSAVLVNSDRIECPCGAKLGRCAMVPLYPALLVWQTV